MRLSARLPFVVSVLLSVFLGNVLAKDIQRKHEERDKIVNASRHRAVYAHHFHGVSNDTVTVLAKPFNLNEFLKINVPKVQDQTQEAMFAAVWLVRSKYPVFEYMPYKTGNKYLPQINSTNPFSPVTTPSQNYIVARPETMITPEGKASKKHAEVVIKEQVETYGALTNPKSTDPTDDPDRVVMYSYYTPCQPCVDNKIVPAIKKAIEKHMYFTYPKGSPGIPFHLAWTERFPFDLSNPQLDARKKALKRDGITMVHFDPYNDNNILI